MGTLKKTLFSFECDLSDLCLIMGVKKLKIYDSITRATVFDDTYHRMGKQENDYFISHV
jgi:hypothetical protein